jgi:hypothetical protein
MPTRNTSPHRGPDQFPLLSSQHGCPRSTVHGPENGLGVAVVLVAILAGTWLIRRRRPA